MLNFLTSYKGLSSLIRGRTKRKDKSSSVTPSDENDDVHLLGVSPDFLLSSSHPIISNITCQPTSSQTPSDPLGSTMALTKANSLRSNASVLSRGTRSTLRHIYQQWDHEKEFGIMNGLDDDDENEELASEESRLEIESEIDLDGEYKSIYIKKMKRQGKLSIQLSTSTLCTVDSSLSHLPEEFQSIHPRISSIESLEDQSLNTLTDNEVSIENVVKIENFYQNQNLLFYNDDVDHQSRVLKPFPFPIPQIDSNSTNSIGGTSDHQKQIKRVKSRLDLKTIEMTERNHSNQSTTTTSIIRTGKASYNRKRRSGMIGGYQNLTEFNQKSKLNVISLIKKTSQPILKLKLSINSLNGSIPTSLATECGMYASNFIEVLEYDKKRVHEIRFHEEDELVNQIGSDEFETLNHRIDSYNLTLSPGTSINSSTPIFKQPKRVHFLEPTLDDDLPCSSSPSPSPAPAPTPSKNRFLSLPLVPTVTSYCQRKKEDWSIKRKSQYLNLTHP
ncbi:hypothetical protein DFH28DRAFT_1083870 [Melampsora americana]|nr:hypothetical protein DFH28DRAFT_1083870 [Melampsora americana]